LSGFFCRVDRSVFGDLPSNIDLHHFIEGDVVLAPIIKLLAYVHMGFGSVYEEELHIHVELGRVTGTRVYDNRGMEIDTHRLSFRNLLGRENCFPGKKSRDLVDSTPMATASWVGR